MNSEDAVLIIFFVAATIAWAIFMGAEDAEGAGTPIWEPDEYMIDETPLASSRNVPFAARGPNNIVYRVWQDDDYAIKVSYTQNNGSSWSDSLVISSSFEGMTSSSIGGIVVLANNTTCVYFLTIDGEDDNNQYVAFRWNWAGAWDIRKIYGGTTAYGYPKMALNGTHLLFMSVYGGNTLAWKTYDLEADTFSTIPATTPEIWVGSWNNANDYDITVNMSGKFIIASESWSGTSYRYYIRDLDKDHAVLYGDTGATVWEVYTVNLMCRSNDTLVIGLMGYHGGQTTYFMQVMNQVTPWGGFSVVHVNNLGAAGPGMDVDSLGSNIDDDNRIYFYWANDTLGGGDVYISKMRGEGGYTEEEWEEAIVDRVYDYGTDDDAWYASSWYDGRYPIVGGYSVNIPNVGWMGHHIWRDEQGAPDDYAFALYWNASFHWYDWSPPGNGGGGDDDEYDDTTTTVSPIDMTQMGELWILLAGTAMFVSLARIYKMHIYRKKW